MNVCAVTYWTPNYAGYAELWAKSALAAGVAAHGVQIGELDWATAVLYKPQFIYEQLEGLTTEFDGLLWTDADSEFMAAPDFGILEGAGAAWHRFTRSRNHPTENLTGTMYFQRSLVVLEFLAQWTQLSGHPRYRGEFTPEQASLRDTLSDYWRERMSIRDLPPEWVWFDDMEGVYGALRPVILHKQASRLHRNTKYLKKGGAP